MVTTINIDPFVGRDAGLKSAIGSTAIRKRSPRTGTYVDWGPEYTPLGYQTWKGLEICLKQTGANMKQTTIFDIQKARTKRDQGLQQVAENNQRFLKEARATAKRIAWWNGTVTMDQVRDHCQFEPLHPNAWGSVFRGKEWEFTGQYVQSKAVSRRGGMQRVWRLK